MAWRTRINTFDFNRIVIKLTNILINLSITTKKIANHWNEWKTLEWIGVYSINEWMMYQTINEWMRYKQR